MSVCWCVAGERIKVSLPGSSLTCRFLILSFAIVLGVLEPIYKKKEETCLPTRNMYMSITEDLIFKNNALRSEWLCIVNQNEAWTKN